MGRSLLLWIFIFMVAGLVAAGAQDVPAVTNTDAVSNTVTGTPEEQLAAYQLQLTNAWLRVIQIVNQPVQAYVRPEGVDVSVYRPGWFHEGAIKPDFDNVDVRQTQQLSYGNGYVTSDLNPGVVFMGHDLEFNSMTKYFYVNRSLPKHRLTEAQMEEINRQYRIIGHSAAAIRRLEHPAEAEMQTLRAEAGQADNADSAPETSEQPRGALAQLQSIPREKRLLYGGIAIGVLVGLAIGLRALRKRSE